MSAIFIRKDVSSHAGSRSNGAFCMRRVRYQVAMSLDGYIAGPNGEADWITNDPEIDFAALYAQFDTFLVGRRTFEAAPSMFQIPDKNIIVFSRTLRPQDFPGVTIVAENAHETVSALRGKPGKDIWLFGGGELFRSLYAVGLVDSVEVGLIPVLLGEGIPLLPGPAKKASLKLTGHKIYKTGIVLLEYAID
jgi:dihydrofolate reductase